MASNTPPSGKTPPSAINRTFLQSWMVLPARTRMAFSLGVCLVGVTGIVISDYLEKKIPPTENTSS